MNMLGNRMLPQIAALAAISMVPTDIAGLLLWLDGNDTNTLYIDAGITKVSADGQAVYRWADKSGVGNHANQVTAGNRPLYKTAILNSKSLLRFDGSNDSLALTANIADNTSTIFAVANNNVSGDRAIVVLDGVAIHASLAATGGYWGTYTSTFASYGPLGSTHKALALVARAASDIDLVENGSVQTKTFGSGWPARGASQIGADPSGVQFHGGDIAEIIVYDSPLSDTNRAGIEAYLISKWGL